jgi:hypothetical protein
MFTRSKIILWIAHHLYCVRTWIKLQHLETGETFVMWRIIYVQLNSKDIISDLSFSSFIVLRQWSQFNDFRLVSELTVCQSSNGVSLYLDSLTLPPKSGIQIYFLQQFKIISERKNYCYTNAMTQMDNRFHMITTCTSTNYINLKWWQKPTKSFTKILYN